MVRSGFREYEVKKLHSPACNRQENAIFTVGDEGAVRSTCPWGDEKDEERGEMEILMTACDNCTNM